MNECMNIAPSLVSICEPWISICTTFLPDDSRAPWSPRKAAQADCRPSPSSRWHPVHACTNNRRPRVSVDVKGTAACISYAVFCLKKKKKRTQAHIELPNQLHVTDP